MESISFVFWNLENLFNPETGGPRKDFTPELGWTWDTFDRKLERMSKVLKKMDFLNGIDLLGVCEVDDDIVINKFIEKCLSHDEYSYVAAKDFGTNNLDTALIYKKDIFKVTASETMNVLTKHPKGDIFLVDLVEKNTNEKFLVSINHWTSRVLGREYSKSFRCTAGENLQSYLWKRLEKNPDLKIITAGDFNDDPWSESIRNHLIATFDKNTVIDSDCSKEAILYNTVWKSLLNENPGSLYYEPNKGTPWCLFDQIIISKGLLKKQGWTFKDQSFSIFKKEMSDEFGIPICCFLRDEFGKGYLQDGISDHFPVSIILENYYEE